MKSNLKSVKILKNLAWFIVLINTALFIFILISLLTLNENASNYVFNKLFYLVALVFLFIFSLIIPAILSGIADIVNNTHTNNLLLSKHLEIDIEVDDEHETQKRLVKTPSTIINCKNCFHNIDDKKCEIYDIKPKNIVDYKDGLCSDYIQK
jgi:hypothetical protein